MIDFFTQTACLCQLRNPINEFEAYVSYGLCVAQKNSSKKKDGTGVSNSQRIAAT